MVQVAAHPFVINKYKINNIIKRGMVNLKKYEQIEEFILAVQEEYPELYIEYELDEVANEYKISHNNEELQSNDDFNDKVGQLAQEMLFENDIYNFFIGYNL